MSRREERRTSGLGTVDDGLLDDLDAPAGPRDDDGVELVPGSTLRRARRRLLADTLRPYRRHIAAAAAFVIVSSFARVAIPSLVQRGIDRGVGRADRGSLTLTLVLLVGAAITDGLAQRLAIRLVGRTAESAVYDLRTRLWQHVQGLSLDWFERQKTGRVISRATTDVDAVYELFSQAALALISNTLTMTLVAIRLLQLDLVLGACVLGVIPALMGATWVFQGRSERAYRVVREKIALVLVHLSESLTGIRVVQAFTREPLNQAQFEDVNGQHLRANAETVRLMSIYGPGVDFLGQLGIVVILLVGGFRALDGAVTIGVLAAFLLYVRMFFDPLQELSQFFNSFQAASAGLEKIAGVLEVVSTVPEAPDAEDLPRPPTNAPPTNAPAAGTPVAGAPAVGAEVRLDHVTFSYGAEPVLHDVDLTIGPGETIALVGATGAGKSTIAKLIARFYDPTVGRVLLDGRDLRELTTASLRSTVAVVPQEAFLFSGTVHDNIALGRAAVTRAQVEAAAVAVGAHGFIAELPEGYDTEVDRRGARLSGGQRQLISFARAWLSDPRVLILDEATSALDLRSERLIQRALAELLADRTAVVIAHRLSSIAVADRVAVIEDGRILELGTPEELLDRPGRFRTLYDRWLESTTANRGPT